MTPSDTRRPTGGHTYQVIYGGHAIGTSRLEQRYVDVAIAAGDFVPLPAYEAVRGIFLLFTEAHDDHGHLMDEAKLARYYQARDALQLTLETAQGQTIPTHWIHIVDWGDLGREIEVQITDAAFWNEEDPS